MSGWLRVVEGGRKRQRPTLWPWVVTAALVVAVIAAASVFAEPRSARATAEPLRAEVAQLRADVRRLERLVRLGSCVTRVYEDGSWARVDPEELTPACRRFVGSGRAGADAAAFSG